MIRLNLISGPRNISTALMYAFAQRPDTTVLDEPFYGYYLRQTGLEHPGRAEVLLEQPNGEDAVRESIFGKWHKPVLFIKNMAHHVELVDSSFPHQVTNLFLIRNPQQILASYTQVIETPTLGDIGIAYQFTQFHRLKANGQHPILVDSAYILEDPESMLSQICEGAGIPFMKDMLQWQPGPKPYDGSWAKYWYHSVHRSSGFQRQPTSNRPLPAHLHALNNEAQYYYQLLLPFSLRP